jgi:chromosome segregation ATPase
MSLDIKRKQLELARVQMAKSELQFRVEEKTDEINKLNEHIKVQEQKEQDLMAELSALNNK